MNKEPPKTSLIIRRKTNNYETFQSEKVTLRKK